MERRTFLAASLGSLTVPSGPPVAAPPCSSDIPAVPNFLIEQYGICRTRGHVAAVKSVSVLQVIANSPAPPAPLVAMADRPAIDPYHTETRDEGDWEVCYYCATRFRTITTTTLEEDNPPTAQPLK